MMKPSVRSIYQLDLTYITSNNGEEEKTRILKLINLTNSSFHSNKINAGNTSH